MILYYPALVVMDVKGSSHREQQHYYSQWYHLPKAVLLD